MIKCKNLSYKNENGQDQLKKVNLNIKKGQVGIILGLKGSGKTTLLDCIGGVNEATSGDVYTYNCRYLKKLPEFCEDLTGTDYIDMLMTLSSKRNKDDIFQLIGNLCLGKQLNKPIKELNAYIRKVLLLLSSFCLDSDTIIVDEPFAHFDHDSQKVIVEIIKKLKAQGKTLLIATNEIDYGFKISDEILILHNGKVNQFRNIFNDMKQYETRIMSLLMN